MILWGLPRLAFWPVSWNPLLETSTGTLLVLSTGLFRLLTGIRSRLIPPPDLPPLSHLFHPTPQTKAIWFGIFTPIWSLQELISLFKRQQFYHWFVSLEDFRLLPVLCRLHLQNQTMVSLLLLSGPEVSLRISIAMFSPLESIYLQSDFTFKWRCPRFSFF